MAETRDFPLGAVLSITTGRLLAPNKIGGVYEILNYMTGSSLFTHQLPRVADLCSPQLLAAYPHLSGEALAAELGLLDESIAAHGPEKGVAGWMEEMTTRFGESLPVSPLASYTPTNPIADLVAMVGADRADKIIVVAAEESPSP